MATDFSDDPDLDFLILQALVNGGRHWDRLYPHASAYAKSVIRRYAPKLLANNAEDIVQRAMETLFRSGGRNIDPAKGSAKSYFHGLVRTAIQHVRASLAPPGSVTRRRGSEKPRMEVVSFDEVGANAVTEAGTAATRIVENRLDATKILLLAPPPVRDGLRLIHFADKTLAEASADAGLSRFQLSRRIFAYSMDVRAAA